jgi:prepilin-type N-terminal cleavage/methylation domain-containing protein
MDRRCSTVGIKRENVMMQMGRLNNEGFTLVELLVAIVLAVVIMAGIFRTFKSQQDAYVIQDQVAAMQQNLRGAMYLITRDLQMAGFYTNFDRSNRTLNWDDRGGTETKRPLIIAGDNVTGVSPIKDNTDTIVIVKASREGRPLVGPAEGASGGTINLSLDLNNPPDGVPDLNGTTKKFGVLIKSDLNAADFFQVNASATPTPLGSLNESYLAGDLAYRADVIIYRVYDPDANNPYPHLVRRNLGDDNATGTYEVVAEHIDNLQFRYQLNNGTWVDDPNGNEQGVRAVQVFLLGRTPFPQRGWTDTETYNFANNPLTNPNDAFRRKLISTVVKTRNVGL